MLLKLKVNCKETALLNVSELRVAGVHESAVLFKLDTKIFAA
jgi:hypothetical protein